jgi:hypothetical protein
MSSVQTCQVWKLVKCEANLSSVQQTCQVCSKHVKWANMSSEQTCQVCKHVRCANMSRLQTCLVCKHVLFSFKYGILSKHILCSNLSSERATISCKQTFLVCENVMFTNMSSVQTCLVCEHVLFTNMSSVQTCLVCEHVLWRNMSCEYVVYVQSSEFYHRDKCEEYFECLLCIFTFSYSTHICTFLRVRTFVFVLLWMPTVYRYALYCIYSPGLERWASYLDDPKAIFKSYYCLSKAITVPLIWSIVNSTQKQVLVVLPHYLKCTALS